MNNSTTQNDLFHWGFSVPEMPNAIELWKSNGAEVIVPPGEAKGLNVICAVVQFRGATIELVAPANDAGREQMKDSLSKGGGLDHVAYFTDNMAGDVKDLISTGGTLAIDDVYNSHFDRNLSFVAMPTGLVVELMDRRPIGKRSTDPLGTFLQQQAIAP